MKLLNSTYGKGRVRVMRLSGEGQNREVRELTVLAMLAGDIAQAYTQADNSTTVSTDTIKNVVNVVAREELEAGPEAFCRAVAKRLLNSYPGMTSATVSAREAVGIDFRWTVPPTRTPSRWMATVRARPKWRWIGTAIE